jgi:hypothetical protein
MRTVFTPTAWALGLLLAATPAWAQQAKPLPGADQGAKPAAKAAGDESGVHRMVIYNGAARTVHYIADGLSPSEDSSLRDLERAENDVAVADQLLALKLQYIRDERQLQARRTEVQRLLYGYSSETTAGLSGVTGAPGYFGYGPYGVSGGYYYPGYGFSGAYGTGSYGFGAGYGGYAGFVGSGSNSLAYGVGDEGAIKTEIAKVLASESSPAYAAQARGNLIGAMLRAGESKALRDSKVVPVLGDPEARGLMKTPLAEPQPKPRPEGNPEGKPESRRETTPSDPVTVTVRLGDRTEEVKGVIVAEDADWLRMRTNAGDELIRSAQVVRVVRALK